MNYDMSLMAGSGVIGGDAFSNLPQNGNDAAVMLNERRINKEIDNFIHGLKSLRRAVAVDRGDIYIDPWLFRDTFTSKRLKMALCATKFSKLHIAVTGIPPVGDIFDYAFMSINPGCPDKKFEHDLLLNLWWGISENISMLNNPVKTRLQCAMDRFSPTLSE